jgi:hypothetical protein
MPRAEAISLANATQSDDHSAGVESWAAFPATYAARPLCPGQPPTWLRCSGRQPWARTGRSKINCIFEPMLQAFTTEAGRLFGPVAGSSGRGACDTASKCRPERLNAQAVSIRHRKAGEALDEGLALQSWYRMSVTGHLSKSAASVGINIRMDFGKQNHMPRL